MEKIIENWYILFGFVVCMVICALTVKRFFDKPTNEQLQTVKEWLLWAVIQAEKHLGSGTGVMKLREVYDMFLTKFPWLAKVITFKQFSDMVENTLNEMEDLLKKNKKVLQYVKLDK